jgi:hypothetical protein
MAALNYFMWGYQTHFQISIKSAAEALVEQLDKEIEIETFLLGLHPNPEPDKQHPVCLEPEDCGFEVSHFASVLEDANHHFAIDEERNLMHMHPKMQASADHWRNRRALQKAVLSALNGFSRNEYIRYYSSPACSVGGYEVSVIAKVTFPEGGIPYEVPRIYAPDRNAPDNSLFDIAIRRFLAHCASALYSPKPESVEGIARRRPEEIIHESASELLTIPVFAAGGLHGLYGLFNSCATISALRYEGGESGGGIIIARPGHPNVEVALQLKQPVSMRQYRLLRKLLEISHGERKLLSDGDCIFGVGKTTGNYNQMEANLYEVRFRKNHSWELLHGGNVLTRVEAGNATLAPRLVDENRFQSDLERILPQDCASDTQLLYRLTMATIEKGHGALIIIHPGAADEALRLANQSTLIEPRVLSPEDMPSLTSIDGAVLLDSMGTCYAIGVILDGRAVPEGDPSRGARFNSCIRYIASQPTCLGVIISEDGDIQWVPELKPILSRYLYNEKCASLKDLLKKKEADSSPSHNILNWMEQHSFYLSDEVCAAGNELAARIVAERKVEGAIYFNRPILAPNPAMNESYFKD